MRLVDIAKVIRSKNAGPLQLTIDLMFLDEAGFGRACQSPALTVERLSTLYNCDSGDVAVIPFKPANAIKIVIDRPVIAGTPGDRDVYGAQQHGPLLELEL
ncbi:DUF4387 domain-containing protein [Microvirga pudoricolor]|uniref:DUF4387 domain-containing protein n=1 Tax=Microvirga pudoricolor TaxID=2778729 RepID=UPI00194FB76D|nr:DUF4387 domain-containing protein [Microvirga pudoricolor]MBM6595317.1 DUF4387 domain-containing protein [Microvirga pudoricolor]